MDKRYFVLPVMFLLLTTSFFVIGYDSSEGKELSEGFDHIKIVNKETIEIPSGVEWNYDSTPAELKLNGVNVKYIDVECDKSLKVTLSGDNNVNREDPSQPEAVTLTSKDVTVTGSSLNIFLKGNDYGTGIFFGSSEETSKAVIDNAKISVKSDDTSFQDILDHDSEIIYSWSDLEIKNSELTGENIKSMIYCDGHSLNVSESTIKHNNPKITKDPKDVESDYYIFILANKTAKLDTKPTSDSIKFLKESEDGYVEVEWNSNMVNIVVSLGTTTMEKEKTNEGLPVWAIVLIIVVVVIAILAVAYYFFLYKKGKSISDLIGKKKDESAPQMDQQQPPTQ